MSNELSQGAIRDLAVLALKELELVAGGITLKYDDDGAIFAIRGRKYRISNHYLANQSLLVTYNAIEHFFTSSMVEAVHTRVKQALPGIEVEECHDSQIRYNLGGRSFTIATNWVYVWSVESIVRRVVGFFHYHSPLERT